MINDVLITFLTRFEVQDAAALAPSFRRMVDALGLTETDIVYAMDEWIPKYWDIKSKGVRMCIGAYMREFIEIGRLYQYQEDGKKLLYGITPSQPALFRAVKLAGGDNVYIGYPDFILAIVLGGFFNRVSLLSSPDTFMNVGCRHCALNRIRVNASLKKIFPAPDAIWSWGLFCDEAPKADEMLECLTNNQWYSIVMRLPHDGMNYEREDEDKVRVRYLAQQYRAAHQEVENRTGIAVSEKDLSGSLQEFYELIYKLDRLTLLVTESDPQPVGGNELALFSTYSSVAFNTDPCWVLAALDQMIDETEKKVQLGKGILPKGSPKLGCHFMPVCVPWVDRAFNKNGVALSFSSHHSFTKTMFLPLSSQNPYDMAAQLWLRNPNSVNAGYHIHLMCEMLERYTVDGMLYGFFTFDRWLGSHQKMTLPRIEEATGIQHFYLEGDFWDDASFKEQERIGRIESIAALLKTKQLLLSLTKP